MTVAVPDLAGKTALEAHAVNPAAEPGGTGVTMNAYRLGGVDTIMQAWIRTGVIWDVSAAPARS